MRSSSSSWNSIKERGSLRLLTLMLCFYRFGGRMLCKIILYFIILWYWLFATQARQASLQYLRQLHHFAKDQSPFQSRPSLLNSYQHLMQFGLSILDKMEGWLGHIPEQGLKLFGHTHFKQAYQKGTLLIVSHFGNIELLRAIKSEHPQKINVLVYQKHASQFNAFLKKLNRHADVNLICVNTLGLETAILLEEKLQQGEWVIVAADRAPVNSNRVQEGEFLGKTAVWPQGAWVLANLLKVPVLAVFCYRQQQHVEVHIHPIADKIELPRHARMVAMQEVTKRYIALLEQHCLRAPYQWFNFYHFWNK